LIDTGPQPTLQRGKNIVGATNSLHYAMLSQDSMLKPLDDAVAKAATTFYDNVYVRWFGPVALLLGLLMFRYIWTGDLASMSKRGMWALAGMWLAASVLVLGRCTAGWIPCCCRRRADPGWLPAVRSGRIRNATRCRIRCTTTCLPQLAAGGVRRPGRAAGGAVRAGAAHDQAWTKQDVNSADTRPR